MSEVLTETVIEAPPAAPDVTFEAPGVPEATFDSPGLVEATVPSDLDLVLDVPLEVAVEIGRTTMTIRETLAIVPGSVVALNRMAGEPVDLLVNGRRIARGEVVAVDEEFGLRVTEVVSPQNLIEAA